MVIVYPTTGVRAAVGSGRRRMPHSIDQAGPARSSLLSYVDDLPRFHEREAYLWREGVRWRRRTYAEVHRRILGCAATLATAGLQPDEPVLIQGPESADWVEALFGTLRAGGVVVPLDAGTPDDLRARIARAIGARFLIAPRRVAPPEGVRRIDLGSWTNAPLSPRLPVLPGADSRAEVIFTSGTTGDPKGVILTHRNLLSDFSPFERGYRRREGLVRAAGRLRFLSTLPLSHMFGQAISVFLPLTMGLTVVFVPARPAEVIEAARRFKAWGLFTVPRLLDLLGAELRRALADTGSLESFDRRQRRLAAWPFYLQAPVFWRVQRMLGWRFRLIVSGGAALPEAVDAFFRRSGYLVVQGYGLTETAPIVSVSNPFDRRAGNVGRPLSTQEVRLGPGDEVLVRGPNVTPGYFGTGPRSIEDGWLRTGDIGEMDDRGRLRIRGRLKEVIVTPEGENVYPDDVEAAFDGLPGVRGVCVIGLPLERGERVHAALLMETGADPLEAVRRANERLLPRQRVRGHTAWPDEDFPRGPTGKIRKALVRERAIVLERDGATVTGAPAASEVRRLVATLARVRPDTIRGTTRLVEGLGFASLDLVELAAAFEEEFGVVLAEERLGETTVGDLERLVRATGADRAMTAPAPAASEGPAAPATSRAGPPRRAETSRLHRGSLRMPRWTAFLAVRFARRLIEELVLVPFVRLHARPVIAGLEHLREAEPPFLFVCNHRSFMDTWVLKAGLPRLLRGRVAPAMTTRYHRVFFGETDGGRGRYLKEWAQVRLIQFFFDAWPLPETAGFRQSLAYSGELMDRGLSLLVFPEGRHVPPPGIEPFRKGIGIFARELRAAIVPARIEGTDYVLPNGRYWPRVGRTRLVLGPPFRVDPDAEAGEVTRQIEEAVRRLSSR